MVSDSLSATLKSQYQMPRFEMSDIGIEGPAFGAALLLHQRMFSIDEKAVLPKGDALIRVTSA